MSQAKLADAVGVTFQQIQKYENGKNRISASRLQQIAQALDVTPSFFFEDVPDVRQPAPNALAEDEWAGVTQFMSSPEALLLNQAFTRIQDARVRRKIISLVNSLAAMSSDPRTSAR